MFLVHTLPSNEYVIPLDAAAASAPAAFATYHEQDGRTQAITHRYVGWRFASTMVATGAPAEGKKLKKAKYQDHAFELRILPHQIDAAIDALTTARRRFESGELPITLVATPVVDADEDEADEAS